MKKMPGTKLSSLEPVRQHLGSPPLYQVKESSDGERGPEKLCFDDMLQKYCGEFGYWQLRHFLLVSSGMIIDAFQTMVMIFGDREPEWRCLDAGNGSRCFSAASSVCELEPGSWEWVGGPASSSVAEFGLVCGQKYKVGLVQALFFGGAMIGAGVFGHLADSRLGRKGSLTVALILTAIFGCLTTVSADYWSYAVFRFLAGFSKGGVGLCTFVLTTEPIGPMKRGIAGFSIFYFFSLGIVILSGVARVFNTWRSLYLVTSVPSVLFLVFVLPFVSESPRWFLIKGKTNQAMKIMQKIAKTNGKHLPDHVVLSLNDEVNAGFNINNVPINGKIESESKEAVTCSLIDVLRSPVTRIRLFLAVEINFLCYVVYNGLSLNVVNLDTNLYFNVLLNALVEMPAILLSTFFLDKFGRKPLAIGTQLFSGVFCVAGSVLTGYRSLKVIQLICGLMGVFGISATTNLLFIYTVELFPTVIRSAALGYISQAAEMGAIISPILVVFGGGIPLAVFGLCGIIGGVLAVFLPETLNMPLYDTMARMEDGERENSMIA